MIDYQQLKGKIVSKGLTQKELASKMQMSQHSLSNKLNGKTDIFIGEADLLCKILNINVEDRMAIFFAEFIPKMK